MTAVEIVELEAGRDGDVVAGGLQSWLERSAIKAVAYFGADATCLPDIQAARLVCDACGRAGVNVVVLISSAAAYGANPHNPGLMTEARVLPPAACDRVGLAWRQFERVSRRALEDSGVVLTILRPAATPSRVSRDCFSRLLRAPVAFTLPGHDPTIQLLSVTDLADAVCRAFERRVPGVFNLAPVEPMTLRSAARLRRRTRVPIPYVARQACRVLVRALSGSRDEPDLDYLRYSWTVSAEKARRELGVVSALTSADALAALGPTAPAPPGLAGGADPFGLDARYIDRFGRTVFAFLQRYYWRIELDGLEHLPREGRGVLVGMHRGFMPLDGVMTLHVIVQQTGRIPRFLIHPGVGLRFPFLSNFMTKLGGVIACRENAAYVLERDEILGVYPEGIRGAFTPYRRAYRIGPSWRDDFVKMALRHRAPIIPFVTVGSAEIFPIIGRIDWPWWKRHTDWPFFPLTPTFPLLPIPLPSKWHTQFLPPIHVERLYPPEAARDAALVASISDEVKRTIEASVQAMLQRRRSIFVGSIFSPRPSLAERRT
jgi:1-acyl-sn-glycerol-3-phosphate acyltransferase